MNYPIADDEKIRQTSEWRDDMSISEDQRRALIKRAWLRWVALWVPFMAIIMVATVWIDFTIIMGVLIAILASVLLYQRYANKRTWRSIMWGVYAREE